MSGKNYDVVIVGGGPAGLSAALYAARARLKTALIEKMGIGGQAAITYEIENYPGFPDGIGGPKLMSLFEQQAKKFGAETLMDEITGIERRGGEIVITGYEGEYTAKAVLLALGAEWRKLAVPGEKENIGRGVSYCATCDGAFFRGRDVAVVGGGNTAAEEALFLTRYVNKVYLIHRRDKLRADKILQERIAANEKITVVWDSVVEQIESDNAGVNGVKVKNVKTGAVEQLKLGGVFVFVGSLPNTKFLEGKIELDDSGYITKDDNMRTSMEGVYAAGDGAEPVYKQVAVAAGDGVRAALAIVKYLEEKGVAAK